MGRSSFRRVLLFALGVALVTASGCAPKKISLYPAPTELRQKVVDAALAQTGRPYRLGARGPDSFDCSGLVSFSFGRAGVTVPATAELLSRVGYEVVRQEVLPGDIVVFRVKGEYHVGIMVTQGDFVHASKSKGVATDGLDGRYWARSLHSFRRIL